MSSEQTGSESHQTEILYETASMCHVCFREIPAEVLLESDGALYMRKTCSRHGSTKIMIERDAEFCLQAQESFGTKWPRPLGTLVEITNRCNNSCPSCYHRPQRGLPDPTLSDIMVRITGIPDPDIVLMGGEPTVRQDLPDIIRAIRQTGRNVVLATNGLRFAEPGYADMVAKSGLQAIGFSLHHPEYSSEGVFKRKLQALALLAESALPVEHIAFSVQHECQVPGILDLMDSTKGMVVGGFRIRSTHAPEVVPFFVSDLYKLLKAESERRGGRFEFFPGCENNRHAVGFLYNGVPVWVLSWPTNLTIDLSIARGGPMAAILDGVHTQIWRGLCIQDGIRHGWFAGHRIAHEGSAVSFTEITQPVGLCC
ncbi:MAG: hypothetical protein A2X94_00830 [Bdellovibrionales bacterium GWB1_55_8]|nr:MAG: hypothetical protein A2X94_00830 [Bdellovibrionales bacterium GWB1_55_8]